MLSAPPTRGSPHRRLIDALTIAVFVVLIAGLGRMLLPALVDDSFIYLRIAANIVHGDGWVYNVGENANAATSVLYTLLVVATGALTGFDAHTLAIAYSVTLFSLLAVQYFAWRESDGWIVAVTIALGSGLSARLLGSFGMECALLLTLVSATALAFRHYGDNWRVGLLAGLTALTRPEGIIVLGVIGLIVLAHRRIAWRSLGVAILTVLPWLLFATMVFGSPLSQTAAVKAAQRHYGWWATQPDFAIGFVLQPRFAWLTVALAFAGLAIAWSRSRKHDAFAIICIGFGIVQVLGYQYLGAPLGYDWYFAPGNFAVDLAILLAGISAVRFVAARQRSPAVSQAVTTIGAIALLFVISRIGMAPGLVPGVYGLSAQYRVGAEWLRTHARPEDSVAATEIGYIGWYSGLRVLDIHGLIHPQALQALRERNLHWWYDRGERPRFVVTHIPPWHGEPGSQQTWPHALSDDFASQYAVVFEHDILRIHERR